MLTAYKIEVEARQLFNKIYNIKTSAKFREFCGRKKIKKQNLSENPRVLREKKNQKTKPQRKSASSAGEKKSKNKTSAKICKFCGRKKIKKQNLSENLQVLREKKQNV